MALDEAAAAGVRSLGRQPTLRFYGWDMPSISIGCFQKISDIDVEYCEVSSLPIVRRPTGGRAILHDHELTYSFSVRTDLEPFKGGLLESYRRISEAFGLAFRKMGVSAQLKMRRERGAVLAGSPLCFQSSSYGELLINGRKAVGSAQRRWEDGLLQQGSVPYSFREKEMCRVFKTGGADSPVKCMIGLTEAMPDLDEDLLKEAVALSFEETFGISLVPSLPAPDELDLARELEAGKYRSREWNFRL